MLGPMSNWLIGAECSIFRFIKRFELTRVATLRADLIAFYNCNANSFAAIAEKWLGMSVNGACKFKEDKLFEYSILARLVYCPPRRDDYKPI